MGLALLALFSPLGERLMVMTGSGWVNLRPARGGTDPDDASGERGSLPARLARVPLFEPVASWLSRTAGAAPADILELNAWLAEIEPAPQSASGRTLKFIRPDGADLGYEERIFSAAEIETRPDNWHDYFNALVWMRFPQTKAALNALHVRQIRRTISGNGRGPLRDAATQFDESGVIAVSADPELLELLARRRWKELFWVRRAEVTRTMRFLVFGHGLFDALRAPFYRICGRTATLAVEPGLIDAAIGPLCAHVDRIIARRFTDESWYPRPRALLALPILGIPGVTQASETADYYEDTDQFRPPPDWAAD
jgi:hypothetical protein